MSAFFRIFRFSLVGLLAASTLHAGAASLVKADRTNVRAKPTFDGEVLTTLSKGDLVEVLDEVPGTGADGALRTWARIALPKNAPVWVYAPFVDSKTKTVKSKVLNLRAGPGRNYSELGELGQGATVTVLREVDGWLQIEPPPNTSAYVSSNLIEAQAPVATKAPALPAVPAPTPAPATKAVVTSTPPPATVVAAPAQPVSAPIVGSTPRQALVIPAAPAPAPAPTATAPTATAPAPAATAVVTPTTATEGKPEATEPESPAPRKKLRYQAPLRSVPDDKEFMATGGEADAKPREVLREGVVGTAWSVQAPGYLELLSLDKEGKLDYLISETPDLDLSQYRGQHVVLAGEEWRDSRWKTPLLKVKSIQSVK